MNVQGGITLVEDVPALTASEMRSDLRRAVYSDDEQGFEKHLVCKCSFRSHDVTSTMLKHVVAKVVAYKTPNGKNRIIWRGSSVTIVYS